MGSIRKLFAFAALCAASWMVCAAEPEARVRLYTLDCGRIEVDDMGMFADTGEYDGRRGTLSEPCFLIRHPKGDLLWDAGLGDRLADKPDGEVAAPGIRFVVAKPLLAQLQELGMSADDIDRLAFSHLHVDHTGNASAFTRATWLLNRKELAWVESGPMPGVTDLSHLDGRKRAKVEMIKMDHDVFGDGTVKILRAAGHTPGHQVLLVKLAKAGVVILSGDLYHTRENFERSRMPTFNYSPGETLASMDRVQRLLKATGGRLVIQHDPADITELPRLPGFLE